MTDAQIYDANSSPHNLKAHVSKPYALHYEGAECKIVLGGNRFTAHDAGYGTQIIPIAIDAVPMVGFILADGHLLFNLNLFDEYNRSILRIVNNHLLFSTTPWDIQFVGRRLTVRAAARQILIDLEFELPNTVRIDRARFLWNGVEVLVWPDSLLVVNKPTQFVDCDWIGGTVGVSIGAKAAGVQAAIYIPEVSRYLGDRTEAIRWAKEITWLSPPLTKSPNRKRSGWPRTGRPAGRGAVRRDHGLSASTRWGCSRTGPGQNPDAFDSSAGLKACTTNDSTSG